MTEMPLRWVEQFDPAQRAALYTLYSKEWWTKDRSFDDVMHMLDHSDLVLGCYINDGQLAGFARVLTDYTFKALIFDVIVNEDCRGHGIGQKLVNRILGHETLSRVKSFELYCPERLIPFYERLGFVRGQSALLFHQR